MESYINSLFSTKNVLKNGFKNILIKFKVTKSNMSKFEKMNNHFKGVCEDKSVNTDLL